MTKKGFKETEIGEIPEGWTEESAENFCKRVTDGTHDSPKKQEVGKYLITSRHIKDGKLDFDNAYFISNKDFEEINKRSKVDQWDLIFGMIGTIGEVYLEKNQNPEYAIKNVGLFKCNSEIKGKWLFYFLKSLKAKDYIFRQSTGTTQQYMTLKSLRNFPIQFPNTEDEIKSIVQILSSLDKKIELNNKINKNLETIGQSLFKKWFIEEAKEEWETGKLKEFGEIICGKTPSTRVKTYFGGKIPFIKIPDMHNNLFILKTSETLTEEGRESQSNKTIPAEAICVSCIATVGLVSITTEDSQTNQQINSIIPREYFTKGYLYYFLKSIERKLKDMGSGGAVTLNVNTTIFSNMEILIPDEQTLRDFDEVIRPIFKQILDNLKQNQTLTGIRDALLPKLMSGEIRVK